MLQVKKDKLTIGGVQIDVRHRDVDANSADVRRVVKLEVEKHGLCVLVGFDGHAFDVAENMEQLMLEFGNAGSMIDFTGTPIDPFDDGDPSAMKCEVPNHPRVRILGNTVDENTGKPTALLAKTGYEWHQDSSAGQSAALSMLYCVESPDRGAETLFAKCSTLWGNLSQEQREFVEEVEASNSNFETAGGPAAFDAAFGLRMNATGTKRIRPANRRRKNWKLNVSRRKLCGIDSRTGERLFWPAAKKF